MPSIKEKLEKSKYMAGYLQKTWLFVGICVVLAGAVGFGTFRLLALFKTQNAIGIRVVEAAFPTNISGKEGAFVASKTGKSYYFPWCGVANRIKDQNLVWFANRASAEAKGYKPASNCRGLK